MARSWITVAAMLVTLAGTSPALASRELARSSGCMDCHGLNEHKLGPSFRAIARRYRSKLGVEDTLFEHIKYGSRGNWNQISGGSPMPQHNRRLSDDEIKALVDWILSL